MTYRSLRTDEITTLKNQYCRADNWQNLRVTQNFTPTKIFNTQFFGECLLGEFHGDDNHCGIEDARLTNCHLHNHANLRRVTAENYTFDQNASVVNVALLKHQGVSSFGNGEKVAILLESGGREITLHAELSAPLVWLEIFADGQNATLWENLGKQVADTHHATRGHIGANATLLDCGVLENTRVAANAKICGARQIVNSTIAGVVAAGAIITNSIINANGYVGVNCLIDHCFVADGARLDNAFKANDSLFFANCDLQRGEAVAIFAAPYTVSQHQSTLLVGALYSFFNAGSGTNFSNHRYKLGAVHQGIFARGVKCGSNSYLLLPAHLGAFTTIVGSHPRTLNTAAFPESLIVEQAGKSILLPGANIFTAGLFRDAKKWRERDRRVNRERDYLHLPTASPLNPLLAETVENALTLLHQFKNSPRSAREIYFGGAEIPATFIDKALARYHAELNFYYGEIVARGEYEKSMMSKMKNPPPENAAAITWVDCGGMLATHADCEKLLTDLYAGNFSTYTDVQNALGKIYQRYTTNEAAWLAQKLTKENGDLRTAQRAALQNWRAAAQLRAELIRRDFAKEFAPEMQLGYGLYNPANATSEFSRVRGEIATQPLIAELNAETEQIERTVEELLTRMR